MLALLKHDLRIMRSYLLVLTVIVCLYAWLLRFSKLLVITTSMAVILSLYIGLLESLLAAERNCRWDRYVLTMPIARETVVQEKYCLMLLAALLPCLAGMCMDGLFYGGAHLFMHLFLLVSCGLLLSLIGPIYLKKTDTGKSALAVILMMILCGFAVGGLSVQQVWLAWRWPVLALLSVIALAALWSSYRIALRIYLHKEF